MDNLFIIISYTIKDMIRRKSFIISNIIIIAIILIGFNVPNIMNYFKGESDNTTSGGNSTLLIIDSQDIFEGSLRETRQIDTNYNIEITNENLSEEEVREKITNNEINSAIVISKTDDTIEATYIVKTLGMTTNYPASLSSLQEIYKNKEIAKLGLSDDTITKINTPIVTQAKQADENEAQGNIFVTMLLSIVLFFAIYYTALQVSTSITTEKTSRIMETLITSTNPSTIVVGKTIGMGLLGLMQTVIIVVVAIISANIFMPGDIMAEIFDLSKVTWQFGLVTVIYFILGYFLFAFLYALTGSTVDKPEDIQSANSPIAIIAVIGFYLAYFTMMNPTSELNVIASIVPISSPFCMPFRIMMGVANINDIIISIAVLILTVIIIARVSVKIYSSAVLNTGSKISIKDALKMYKQKD